MALNNKVSFECEFGGRNISIETGRFAKQADGSVVVRYGDTMVLVTATSARTVKPGQDFFPLTVDYIEKYYAVGKFPGGFFKREARPSSDALLSARLIDRPIRPLFPEGYMYTTHIQVTVLSSDEKNSPDIAATLGASCALLISDIPFSSPIGSVRVGRNKAGEWIANPSYAQLEESDLEILVASTKEAVVMVEGECSELSEEEVLEAIKFAHEEIQKVIELQKKMQSEVGRKVREYEVLPSSTEMKKEVEQFAAAKLKKAFEVKNKLERYAAIELVHKEIKENFLKDIADQEEKNEKERLLSTAFMDVKYEIMRNMIVKDKKRLDGRDMTSVRPIEMETGILPRAHGSALFTRGETQVLSAITLGTKEDEQIVDNLRSTELPSQAKKFLLHYNFPPFSVGETGPLRPPGRREIGHGNLAERAIKEVLPSASEFPYTIRVVCETLESNGSSSMGSVCSGILALMDAGVPIKKPVAGIAMGLIQESSTTEILTDILGDEDHLGDMDFKVAGTEDGITAIQMDIKIGGVTNEILSRALMQAKEGRLHILKEMIREISSPREDISMYAPRVYAMKVDPSKIAAVIGTGGKIVRSIIEECNVKVDIEDTGDINISSINKENAEKAIAMIESIVEEVEPGKVYTGTVVRIVNFGAFVAVAPGKEGLLHVSEIAHERVHDVRDHLSEGDKVKVKVLDVDRTGRMKLSHKALLDAPEGGSPGHKDYNSYPSDRDGGGDFYNNRYAGSERENDRGYPPHMDSPRRPFRNDRRGRDMGHGNKRGGGRGGRGGPGRRY